VSQSESRTRRSSSAEPQSHARTSMVVRSPSALRRRESAAAVPYTGTCHAPATWSPHRAAAAALPEVKLVPDPGGGATCVRATELTDEELEAMLYRLHRVRRRRASEAAAANSTHSSSQLADSTAVRSAVETTAHLLLCHPDTNYPDGCGCLWVGLFVCLSVCVSQKPVTSQQNLIKFSVHDVCRCGSALFLAALQYVMYFRFCG